MTAAKDFSVTHPTEDEGNLPRSLAPWKEISLSTLCPHCSGLMSWYRTEHSIFGYCNEHGIADTMPIKRTRRG